MTGFQTLTIVVVSIIAGYGLIDRGMQYARDVLIAKAEARSREDR